MSRGTLHSDNTDPGSHLPDGLATPSQYRLQVAGRLRPGWSAWFKGLAVSAAADDDPAAVTTLEGAIVDQAMLHSILSRIRDLGLNLLLVEYLGPASAPDASEEG